MLFNITVQFNHSCYESFPTRVWPRQYSKHYRFLVDAALQVSHHTAQSNFLHTYRNRSNFVVICIEIETNDNHFRHAFLFPHPNRRPDLSFFKKSAHRFRLVNFFFEGEGSAVHATIDLTIGLCKRNPPYFFFFSLHNKALKYRLSFKSIPIKKSRLVQST